MSTVNWISVLKLEEFQLYFNINELQRLSMVSNRFRTALINIIFKVFNFKKFVLNRKYYSYFINEQNFDNLALISYSINPYKPLNSYFFSSKNKFKLDLKEFLSYPSQLIISNSKDYSYLLYDVPKPFLNITSMVISYSQLQFELLQYLLDSLNFLEVIELLNTQFIQYTQNSVQRPFTWPIKLKKLKLSYNELGFTLNKEAPICVSEYGNYMVPKNGLVLPSQNLPNLVSFDYSMLGHMVNNNDAISFLKLNQQIKYLNIEIFDFNPSLFNGIESLGKLSHLGLHVAEFYPDEHQGIELPALDTITHLSTTYQYYVQKQPYIFNMFPNITNLSIKIDNYTDEDTLSLIQNLTMIESLKLDIYYARIQPKELTLPKLDNLTNLEFNLNCIKDISINDFKWSAVACPNLNLVKFKKFINLKPFEEPKLSAWMENNWKTVYYPLKVVFHRMY
jgi:hypothetical protein